MAITEDTRRLTVAITGPTGEIGQSVLAALERSRSIGHIVGMALIGTGLVLIDGRATRIIGATKLPTAMCTLAARLNGSALYGLARISNVRSWPLADISCPPANVCFWPKADIR